MGNKLMTIIKGAIEKISGDQNKIKFPPEYYEPTDNLKENLCKYKVAIEEVKAKYDLFLLKGVNDQGIYGHKSGVVKKYERGLIGKMGEELEYARLLTHYRLGDVTSPGLKKLIKFAEKYDRPIRVKDFKKELRILRGRNKLIYVKNLVRGEIAEDLMRDIKFNVKPGGERAEYPLDWSKKLTRLMNELEKNKLVLSDEGQDDKIREIWSNISRDEEQLFRTNLQEKEAQAKSGREENYSQGARARDLVISR